MILRAEVIGLRAAAGLLLFLFALGVSSGYAQDTSGIGGTEPDSSAPSVDVDTAIAAPALSERDQALELNERAERTFERGDQASVCHAKDLWLEAAALHEAYGDAPGEAAVRNSAGRAYQKLGERDSALGQFGRAIALTDTAGTRTIVTLLNTSPVLEPSRSVVREASFVKRVKALLAGTAGGAALADNVGSATDAMAALDALSAARRAVLRITSPQPLFVQYRRWAYRNAPRAPWTPLTTDTTIVVSAVTYQLRYTDPTTHQVTIIDWPCADGCAVKLPVPREPSP